MRSTLANLSTVCNHHPPVVGTNAPGISAVLLQLAGPTKLQEAVGAVWWRRLQRWLKFCNADCDRGCQTAGTGRDGAHGQLLTHAGDRNNQNCPPKETKARMKLTRTGLAGCRTRVSAPVHQVYGRDSAMSMAGRGTIRPGFLLSCWVQAQTVTRRR